MNRAAIVCQKQWRCFRARRLYVNTVEQQLQAAYVIQHFWIAHKQSSLRQGAAVDIQARVRGFLCRQRLLRINAAATSIQTAWRGFLCQVVYHIDLMDIVAVQSRVRGYFAIQEKRRRKHAATVISRSVASFVYRKKLELDKTRFAAAILCQVRSFNGLDNVCLERSVEIILTPLHRSSFSALYEGILLFNTFLPCESARKVPQKSKPCGAATWRKLSCVVRVRLRVEFKH